MTEYDARLTDRVRSRGVLTADDAARLLLPVAESLASIHEAHGLHGAISPAAVQVDSTGRALLLDRTRAGPEPAYSPPDPAMGLRPNPADDVWSLAAVLLFVTTGHPPSAYGTPLVVPRAVDWLAPLVELALRPDPRDRPTATEVVDYLRARVAPTTPRPRRLTSRPVLVGAATIALLGVVGAALLFGGREATSPRSADPGTPSTTPPTESESPTAEPVPEDTEPPTAADLEAFARDYVVTASGDPATGYTWLTPDYQQRSPRYQQVWSEIVDPRILAVTADPAAMSVTYTYRYRLRGGGERTEEITLFLVQQDGRLFIADATAR